MGGDHTPPVPCLKGNMATVMEHMGKLLPGEADNADQTPKLSPS